MTLGLRGLTPWPLILVAPAFAASEAANIAERLGLALFRSVSHGPLLGAAEAARHFDLQRILLVHGLFGLNLLPASFLVSVCRTPPGRTRRNFT